MFPNNNQQNKKQTSVNTRGRRQSNEAAEVPALMELGYWDSFATFRIHPALPAEMRSDTKKWDLENYLQASVSDENASIILQDIIKHIEPAIEKGESAQTNVIIGGDSVFQIKTENVDGNQVTRVMIAKNLDPNSKKPNQKMYYYLKNTIKLSEYDEETGTAVSSVSTDGQLGKIKWHLIGLLLGGSNGTVHAHRVVDRNFRERLLGTASTESNNGFYKKNNDVFGGNQSQSNGYKNENPFGVDPVNADQLNDMMKM